MSEPTSVNSFNQIFLDTNILVYLSQQSTQKQIVVRLKSYIANNRKLAISRITRYELLRNNSKDESGLLKLLNLLTLDGILYILSGMVESERKLVGYINPLVRIYPTPLVAVVLSSDGPSMIYPDGTSQKIDNIDETHVRLLRQDSQVPYRVDGKDELMYGISENHIVIGDRETVLKHLRLNLSFVDEQSNEFISMTEFIQSLESSTQ